MFTIRTRISQTIYGASKKAKDVTRVGKTSYRPLPQSRCSSPDDSKPGDTIRYGGFRLGYPRPDLDDPYEYYTSGNGTVDRNSDVEHYHINGS